MSEELKAAIALLDAAHAEMAAAIAAMEKAHDVSRFPVARGFLDATYHSLMG